MSTKNSTISLFWDRLGISLSVLCAIHCLFVPIVLALLPLTPHAAAIEEWLHPIFIVLILPTIFYASSRSHYNRTIVTLLLSGFGLIIAGWLLGHYWLGEIFETSATLLGSVILIIGHWRNYNHHRTCNNARHKHHPLEESLLKKEKNETP
ncbi:MerC domain-containing protein [Gracilimonas sp.]|uniref:MerC domain-containing protein n=1 Tax=Gracilimonas sp. TaxID=1974203 RepID=UPI00287235CA|nr:MerC domain-containing protein [Gracilimonas sp.]